MSLQREPLQLDMNLAASRPFPRRLSRQQRAQVRHEIGRLRNALGHIVLLTAEPPPGSLIEKRFKKLIAKEKWVHPLRGVEQLSHKLTARRVPRTDKELQATLYALLRLRIAHQVVKAVRAEQVTVFLPEPLALFRMEGNLDVPLALDRLADGFGPPALTPDPFGEVADWFKGPHHTFFLEKSLPSELAPYIQGIQQSVTTHEEMRRALAKGETHEGHDVLRWLASGKQGALTLYLHILGGLDIYSRSITPPTYDLVDPHLNDFKYHYARNRVFIDPQKPFDVELARGAEVYRAITSTTEEDFLSGKQAPQALMATTFMRNRKTRWHHFLPKNSVDFTAVIIQESVITLEALRRAPLINGSPRFDPPLPHMMAYMRYNAGDIYFLVIVLTLLKAIVFEEKFLHKQSSTALNKLKQQLKDFKKSESKVWTVLKRWRTESSYYLKEPDVRKQIALHHAIVKDAAQISIDLHGPHEKRHMDALNTKGEMNTAHPLLQALTEQELWYDFQQVVVAHIIGWLRETKLAMADRKELNQGKPWLNHSPFLNAIGRRTLRFYYMHRGFHVAFDGVDIDTGR